MIEARKGPSHCQSTIKNPQTVANAANVIKVVSEIGDASSGYTKAAELLAGASRIYFLGFGFLHDNIRRLRVFGDAPWPGEQAPIVAGTRLGFADREWDAARRPFGSHWTGPAVNSGVIDFLRAHADLT